ncbi:MAG: YaiI/YqxD family protein [Planctomycetota bacterium]|nr:YaiI/YqxD family protein [Planctomycetota bacterium]
MKIWIDADAAPRPVKDVVFRAARKNKLETILVANQSIATPPGVSSIRSIAVRHGANEADNYIAEHAEPGDMVITADIPLAERLVQQEIVTIDPRGEQYHADNIASRLSMRDFMDDLRGAGAELGGSRPYNDVDKREFSSTFDRLLHRLMRDASRKGPE